MKKYILFTLAVLAIIQTGFSQEIKGKIIDQVSKEPIVSAKIYIDGTSTATLSDGEGNFTLASNTTSAKIKISALGFVEKEIDANSTDKVVIELVTDATTIDQVIVTANREASSRKEAPISISRLSPKLLDEAKVTSIYEVINKTPGVLMTNLNTEQHSMSIRQPMTTNNYFLYLEDGIAIRPTGVFNHNSLLEINQFSTNSIEVVKGPVSSLYGPEAIGGAINVLTHRPTAVPTAKVGIQFDQWGYKRVQFGAGATIGKFGMYVGGLSSQQKDAWMTYSDYEKTTVNARLEYHFTPTSRLIGTFMYGKYNSDMSGSADSTAFFSRQYVSTNSFSYRKSDASRSRLTYEKDWKNGSKSFITAYNRYNRHGQNPSYGIKNVLSAGKLTTKAKGEVNSNNFESYGVIAQHGHHFKFLKSHLIAGASYDVSPADYWSYYLSLNAKLRPDGKSVEEYTIAQARPDSFLVNYNAMIYNSAVYLQYDLEPVKNLKVSLGGRYDNMYFTYNNLIDNTSGNIKYKNFAPKIGVTYQINKNHGVYANAAQGFTPPGLTSIFRPKPKKSPSDPTEFYYNLKPAVFMNYEIGGWSSIWKRKISIDYSFYRMEGTNELLSIRQQDGSSDYQSAGKTLHQGIELGLTFKPTSEFSFRWSGAASEHKYIDFDISQRTTDALKQLDNKMMPAAPTYIWNTELSYYPKYVKNLRASVEWQHVSSYYQNQINTIKYDGYDIFHVRLGYKFKGIEVYTNIMNITDVLYSTSVSRGNNATDRSTYTPAAPRTFVFGIQYNFAGKK